MSKLLGVLVVVALAGCVAPAAAFRCTSSAQCTNDGVCQSSGWCSFGDPTCPNGQRYGTASGSLAGICVGEEQGGDPPRCDIDKPFGRPVPVEGVASATEDASMRLSADERTAYFFSARTGTKLLYGASRSSATAAFENVSVLANVNTDNQYNPAITPDGLTLFFASFRAGGPGDNDIYQATRGALADDFAQVRPAPNVNTAASEVQPYITRDGAAMYFVRLLPSGQTVFRAIGSATAGFTNPSVVTEIDGATNDTDPVLSADGLTLFWGSDRPEGMGDVDVWQARRATTSDPFTALAPIPSVNSSVFESPSDVSVDGCRLYLTSARDGRIGIYVATRPP